MIASETFCHLNEQHALNAKISVVCIVKRGSSGIYKYVTGTLHAYLHLTVVTSDFQFQFQW